MWYISYWAKWIISYLYIELCLKKEKRRFDIYDVNEVGDPEKSNFIFPRCEYVLESPVPDPDLLKGRDEVFFWGTNSKQEQLVVSISRRGGHKADGSVSLRLSTGKIYFIEIVNGEEQETSDGRLYSCGNLQIYFTSPMRRWRLFYNGYLTEIDEDEKNERTVYVKFSISWRASSDVFDYSSDLSPRSMANIFSAIPWKGLQPPVESVKKALNYYGQSGSMHGNVYLEDESTPYEMYLFGERLKFFDDLSCLKEVQLRHLFGYIPQNGSYLNISVMSSANNSEKLCFGFLLEPDTTVCPLTKSRTSISNDLLSKQNFEIDFCAKMSYTLKGSVLEDNKLYQIRRRNFEYSLNGKKGKGLIFERPQDKRIEVMTLQLLKAPTVVPLAVLFEEHTCQISEVTGGKGSSLGKLTQFSQKLKTFIVPNGIVVTTASYERFVTNEILNKVKFLEDVLYENIPGDIKEACNIVSEEILKSLLPENVSSTIFSKLQMVFGENFHQKKFAVRSSATGEDTDQMSAAGQMETFLGVLGGDQILQAVKKCWASQFGYIAVQYKRRYGQPLNSPMAVVIQEMVSCDRAGVLFTCDPLTGNPTKMSITANYGLGESVVSGSEEPDSITLQRDAKDELVISDKIIGAKSRRIVVKEHEGTSLEDVPENERNNCCLTDSEILILGKLSLHIEKLYRSSRDIEWGFYNSNLYIFQSRPVTSGSQENDFDIDHEFDLSMLMESEFFSISNVGEVMPGAFTSLGYQLFNRVIAAAFKRNNPTEYDFKENTYFFSGMMLSTNHAMFNVLDIVRNTDGKNIDAVTQSTLIAFFGRIIDDEELYQAIAEKYEGKVSRKSLFRVAKMLLLTSYTLRKYLKHYSGYRIPVEKYSTSTDLFNDLTRRCSDFYDAFICHMICTQSSSIWNLMLITILGKARGSFDDVVYRDFANLLTAISDVESADVPSAMQSVAFHIAKSIPAEEFKKMDSKNALEWLMSSSSSVAGQKFKQFLERHGHRCLKEFEIRTVTWGTNPEPLVKILQNFVGNVSKDSDEKIHESVVDIISKLKVPLEFYAKLGLRILLPFSRRAVQLREKSKSLIIKCMDHWRKGFCHLAKLMVAEGRLPDKDLIFFLTLEDIRELLETRAPKIIAKAFHRRKRYPIMDKYMFPEIMKGLPVPINMDESPIIPSEENFMMKGIPVSQGIAKGFVRVALSLEEAASLKPGEILLTHSTDIGWSPYFPTLAGVVTELGGLISHGAVVSREYGIPCIAGLHGATRMFQTGEYVLLDGNQGILQKLTPP